MGGRFLQETPGLAASDFPWGGLTLGGQAGQSPHRQSRPLRGHGWEGTLHLLFTDWETTTLRPLTLSLTRSAMFPSMRDTSLPIPKELGQKVLTWKPQLPLLPGWLTEGKGGWTASLGPVTAPASERGWWGAEQPASLTMPVGLGLHWALMVPEHFPVRN